MKNEGATTRQSSNDPKPEAAALLEKAYAGCSPLLHLVLSFIMLLPGGARHLSL